MIIGKNRLKNISKLIIILQMILIFEKTLKNSLNFEKGTKNEVATVA